jgi:hypothetical protein
MQRCGWRSLPACGARERAMQRAVEMYAIVNLLVIGLSHVLQPHAWVDFFVYLRERGRAGVFATAFLSLIFGSLIVAFHDVWSGLPVVLTVLGWGQVTKATIYFLFPGFGLRKLHIPSHDKAYYFVYGGVLLFAIAGVLIYHLATTG